MRNWISDIEKKCIKCKRIFYPHSNTGKRLSGYELTKRVNGKDRPYPICDKCYGIEFKDAVWMAGGKNEKLNNQAK